MLDVEYCPQIIYGAALMHRWRKKPSVNAMIPPHTPLSSHPPGFLFLLTEIAIRDTAPKDSLALPNTGDLGENAGCEWLLQRPKSR